MEPKSDTKDTTSSPVEQSTSEQPELTQIIEHLSGLVDECPCYTQDWEEGEQVGCEDCLGTVTVERFPSLRLFIHVDQKKCSSSCTGYYPAPLGEIDLGALLMEAGNNGVVLSINASQGRRPPHYIVRARHEEDLTKGGWGSSDVPTEAVLRAINAALQTQTSPVPNDLPESPD